MMDAYGEWNWRHERRFFAHPSSALRMVGSGDKGFIVTVEGYLTKKKDTITAYCYVDLAKSAARIERIARKQNPEAVVALASVRQVRVLLGEAAR